MTAPVVEAWSGTPGLLSKGPRWHEERAELLWVDIRGYVLAAGQGLLFIDDHSTVHELAQPEAGRTDVRMNDGACDCQGRFWAGTMAYDESLGRGSLYRLELDGSCSGVLSGLTIANGIGLSPGEDTMYLNDSGAGTVTALTSTAGPARSPDAARSCKATIPKWCATG